MIKHLSSASYQDNFEYHGSTSIVQTRKRGNTMIWKKWILFDSVREAKDFFNDRCETERAYV
ncbi:hypothetical protein QUF76_03820 [Desulfobacterales bacterium HSG16]|nr:hypothetical protein [Desulfobacterales bacterium HSG16]